MLPSQFLNVVLEEFEGDVDSGKTRPSQLDKLKGFVDSPLRQQLSVPVDICGKTGKLSKDRGWEGGGALWLQGGGAHRLPGPFLDECTIELCRAPPAPRRPLPEPRFEVLLLPVFTNKSGKSSNKGGREAEEGVAQAQALPEVEAVYSDPGSDSDEEIVLGDPSPPDSTTQTLQDPSPSDSTTQARTGGREDGGECQLCHKQFPSRGALWTHTTVAHPDRLSCECHICGRVFHRNCNLAVHLKSHEAEGGGGAPPAPRRGPDTGGTGTPSTPPPRPFRCPCCTKSYSQRSVLKKHMVIHTGERLSCGLCGIHFTQKSSLLRHAKRLHSGTPQPRRTAGRRAPRRTAPRRAPPPLLHLLSCAQDTPNLPPPTDHSVDMPQQMANFIQSLKIPQGISISMIDD